MSIARLLQWPVLAPVVAGALASIVVGVLLRSGFGVISIAALPLGLALGFVVSWVGERWSTDMAPSRAAAGVAVTATVLVVAHVVAFVSLIAVLSTAWVSGAVTPLPWIFLGVSTFVGSAVAALLAVTALRSIPA